MYLTKLHRIKRTFGVSMLLAATFFCQSCNSFLDVDVRHAASENQQWQTFEDTRAALMGVYGLMRSALAENNIGLTGSYVWEILLFITVMI